MTSTRPLVAGLTDERDWLGRGGRVLGDEQHEHGERQQNGDAERHFLAGLGRQPEPGDAQHAEPQTRTDDVEQVVQSSTPNRQVERHVRVRLVAARIRHLVALP